MKNLLIFLSGIVFTFVAMDLTNCILTVKEDRYENNNCPNLNRSAEDMSDCFEKYRNMNPKQWAVTSYLIQPGVGLFDPLTGRCIKSGSPLPGGHKAKGRDYFLCNKIQVLMSDILYGPNGERYY